MMYISTKALRTRVLEVLDCVDRGEPVTLTYRGKERAKLISVDRKKKSTEVDSEMLPVFGIWSDLEDEPGDVEAYVRSQREGRFHVDRY